jgi:hypothetical protein
VDFNVADQLLISYSETVKVKLALYLTKYYTMKMYPELNTIP